MGRGSGEGTRMSSSQSSVSNARIYVGQRVVHSHPPGVRSGCAEMDSKPVNLIWFIPA